MNPKFMRNGLLMLVLVIGISALLYTWLSGSTPQSTSGYGEFIDAVKTGQVASVIQKDQMLEVTGSKGEKYTVVVPSVLTDVYKDMTTAATEGGKTLDPKAYSAMQAPDNSWLGLVLTGLLPLIVIGGFIYFMMRQAQGTNNQAMSFGKSRARMFLGNKQVVTFNDVAGV
ncbi:MAG: ATP-dependent metallopeptidase FtsH/Yme1/Tma family protein, partial [Chloroflexota bacterium]